MADSKDCLVEKNWHRLFEFGIALKGFNGIWETLGGFIMLFIDKELLNNLYSSLLRSELRSDPDDGFIKLLGYILRDASPSARTFAAFYVFFHGLLNIFLAIQLFREKLWAYSVTIWLMSLFVVYQIYRIYQGRSLLLAIVTAWDAVFIFIIRHEYVRKRAN